MKSDSDDSDAAEEDFNYFEEKRRVRKKKQKCNSGTDSGSDSGSGSDSAPEITEARFDSQGSQDFAVDLKEAIPKRPVSRRDRKSVERFGDCLSKTDFDNYQSPSDSEYVQTNEEKAKSKSKTYKNQRVVPQRVIQDPTLAQRNGRSRASGGKYKDLSSSDLEDEDNSRRNQKRERNGRHENRKTAKSRASLADLSSSDEEFLRRNSKQHLRPKKHLQYKKFYDSDLGCAF